MKFKNSNINTGKKQVRHCLGAFLSMATLVFSASHAVAQQTFDSGSEGTNGTLNLTLADAQPDGTIVFNPQAMGLVPDQNNAYHFTTINVESGVTVKMRSDILGISPVIWLASGDVTIDGTLDLNGEGGHDSDEPFQAAIAGAGGFNGGIGVSVTRPASPGYGPGGGNVATSNNRGGGGAGHFNPGGNGFSSLGGSSYGNNFLIPLLGGSGGAGGGTESSLAQEIDRQGSGGGAGGGAILIASSTQIQVNGSISCNGGNGGNNVFSSSFDYGGGGSGGSIRLMANTLIGSGGLYANRGDKGIAAGDGSFGRIRNEFFDNLFTGTIIPGPINATPALVFPLSGPSVRVVRLSGLSVPPNTSVSIDLPLNPTGSFTPADVVIDEGESVTFEIEASNIPLGTVVNLTLRNETEGEISFSSTPLGGTEANSTATATTSIPHGFSRFTIEANWDPGT